MLNESDKNKIRQLFFEKKWTPERIAEQFDITIRVFYNVIEQPNPNTNKRLIERFTNKKHWG